jgi:hypothetical protein
MSAFNTVSSTKHPHSGVACCHVCSSELDVIKATLLGSLLFLDKADLLREWRIAGGPAAAAALAAIEGPAPSSFAAQQQMGNAEGTAHLGGAGDMPTSSACPEWCVQRVMSDPHPALQLLLAVDVSAVIAVLSEVTAGWDAVETDLRVAAGKSTHELESVLVATQVRGSCCWWWLSEQKPCGSCRPYCLNCSSRSGFRPCRTFPASCIASAPLTPGARAGLGCHCREKPILQ